MIVLFHCVRQWNDKTYSVFVTTSNWSMRTHLAIKRIEHVVVNEIYINIILFFQFPTSLDTAYSVLITRNISGSTIRRNSSQCDNQKFRALFTFWVHTGHTIPYGRAIERDLWCSWKNDHKISSVLYLNFIPLSLFVKKYSTISIQWQSGFFVSRYVKSRKQIVNHTINLAYSIASPSLYDM